MSMGGSRVGIKTEVATTSAPPVLETEVPASEPVVATEPASTVVASVPEQTVAAPVASTSVPAPEIINLLY